MAATGKTYLRNRLGEHEADTLTFLEKLSMPRLERLKR